MSEDRIDHKHQTTEDIFKRARTPKCPPTKNVLCRLVFVGDSVLCCPLSDEHMQPF